MKLAGLTNNDSLNSTSSNYTSLSSIQFAVHNRCDYGNSDLNYSAIDIDNDNNAVYDNEDV